jgi:hypothetical protein
MSDSDMVAVHKGDLAYLLAHVADEIHGHPDHVHWFLPFLQHSIIRLNHSLGENMLIDLERPTLTQPTQASHELHQGTAAPEDNPFRRVGRLHDGELRPSQSEIKYSFDAKRTPSARRIEILRDEIAVWLRTHGYVEVEQSLTYLDTGAVGNVSCTRTSDEAIFNIDVRGGYRYGRSDSE